MNDFSITRKIFLIPFNFRKFNLEVFVFNDIPLAPNTIKTARFFSKNVKEISFKESLIFLDEFKKCLKNSKMLIGSELIPLGIVKKYIYENSNLDTEPRFIYYPIAIDFKNEQPIWNEIELNRHNYKYPYGMQAFLASTRLVADEEENGVDKLKKELEKRKNLNFSLF